jgi:hypothetical protein
LNKQHDPMTKYLFSIILACGLIIQTACLQNSNETKSCYSDRLSNKEKVFTEMPNKPHFTGGHDSFGDSAQREHLFSLQVDHPKLSIYKRY